MIYILYQNKFGGTDLLLKRLEVWLKSNEYDVVSDTLELTVGVDVELVITPTSEMHRIWQLKECGINPQKILVWCMGHGAFKAAFYNKNFENVLFGIPRIAIDFLIGRFAISLIKTSSIVFTDAVGLHYDLSGINLSDCNINDLLHPIAIKNYTSTCHSNNREGLAFGWVGRISRDFKVLPLLKLMRDLDSAAMAQGESHKLIVVGDGDGSNSFEAALREIKYLHVDWIREIDNNQILEFIDINIDILFAMGTSALDGANSATPTVIIQPFSHESERPTKGYRWIFESKGFSLGEFPNANTKPTQIEADLESIFSDIGKYGLNDLAKKSKQYTTEFYEDNVFAKMFAQKRITNVRLDTLVFLKFLTWFNKTKITLKRILSTLQLREVRQK